VEGCTETKIHARAPNATTRMQMHKENPHKEFKTVPMTAQRTRSPNAVQKTQIEVPRKKWKDQPKRKSALGLQMQQH
jgi:hypothetical protein